MGKNKQKRFAENLTFNNLIQPEFGDAFRRDHPMKGRWGTDFFGNDHPVTLELGCGRGEYTVALAEMFPERNFIGVDIKGARMWRGAKTATERGMANVGFLRTRIEVIDSFFAAGEVSEIWITFPDPQLNKNRVKKRLTAPGFLARYARFLPPDGRVNLKTDSHHLHDYTLAVAAANGLTVDFASADIYGEGVADRVLSIRTAYESRFLDEGRAITYMRFAPGGRTEFAVPEFAPDENF
jgi:tRNA (guanine-N7-)-methyltransferase